MPRSFISPLDIPTLMIALSVVYLGSVLFSAMLYLFRRSFSGAGQWIAGQIFLAIGALGVAAQARGLSYSMLAVSNVSMIAGTLLFGHAVSKFRNGKGFPAWSYGLVPLSLIGWFALKDASVALRVVAFSGMLGVLSAVVTALLLARGDDERDGGQRILAVYFAAVSLTGLVRAGAALLGRPGLTIEDSGSMGGFLYLLALLVAFFNLFGYYLLSSAKIEQDLRTREREGWQRNEELVETIETKDALIAVIGHDLRTPVWSASRYVRNHLVEYSGDLNDKRESIETLAEGLDRISGLLDSLLEWALCASGKIRLQTETLRLADAIAGASADMAQTATAKNVTVACAVGEESIMGDRRALETVLRNLLSNAVKYSKPGSTVRLDVSETERGDKSGRVVISVEDSGVGIKPDQLSKLFIPGRTPLTLGTAGEQGKGFGLAISKLFIEAMGGSLTVESELGSGSRFELVFPKA